ncbi:hypothetical protein [Cupriavidus sp. BIS7]|nr:hypothetical protein [Cupriavidus sp. BIS7]
MKVRYLIPGLLLAILATAACSTSGGMTSQGSQGDNTQNPKSYRGSSSY